MFFARPEGVPTERRFPPSLASWNVAGHPEQLRHTAPLVHAEQPSNVNETVGSDSA
jgi:hypothetical protein